MSWKSVKLVSECAEANSGNRRTMEDAHCAIDNFAGVEKQGLFAVFDGHGGSGIVKYLEANFVELLKKQFEAKSGQQSSCFGNSSSTKGKLNKVDVLEALIACFSECDTRSAKEGINTSGSTAAASIIRYEGDQRILYTANVGDTRVVLCRAGNVAERLTHDHTANDPDEVQRIEKAGGFILRKRVLGILSVARAIGDHAMKKYIISRPYTSTVQLKENDRFLIIACDGVWDVFSDEEAVNYLTDIIDTQKVPLEETSERLVAEAIKRGSQDNITALVIHL